MSAIPAAIMIVRVTTIARERTGCDHFDVIANTRLLTIGLYLDETFAVNTGYRAG